MNDRCNSLVWDAVPTLFDVPNPPKPVAPQRKPPLKRKSPPLMTERAKRARLEKTYNYLELAKARSKEEASAAKKRLREHQLPMKKVLRAKNLAIWRLKKRLAKKAAPKSERKSIGMVLDSVKSMLTDDEYLLIKTKLENKSRKKNQYSDEFKQLCISISFKSPGCYKFLAKRLKLPPHRTVRRWLEKIDFKEGFDPFLFDLLKARASKLKEKERIVTLLADEISLKENCDYDRKHDKIFGVQRKDDGSIVYPSNALVFMIAGVCKKFRQAVAYFFNENAMPGSDFHPMLLDCITRIEECGFKVVKFTSDQGSNLHSVLDKLQVTPEGSQYFMHNGHAVYVSADPPHLVKSVRNTLYNGYTIETSYGKASWKYIKDFYDIDCAQNVRLAPRLTDNHVKLPPIWGKMKVKLATQIFSNSVATGMHTYIARGLLPYEAMATADFCAHMNNIFDILNSSTQFSVAPHKRALRHDTDMAYINQSIAWLKSFRIINKEGTCVNAKFRCVDGLVLALNCLKGLMFYLHNMHGLDYLLTRRLCQDPLENYFSLIRQKSGFNQNPSCLAFKHSYKSTQVN